MHNKTCTTRLYKLEKMNMKTTKNILTDFLVFGYIYFKNNRRVIRKYTIYMQTSMKKGST